MERRSFFLMGNGYNQTCQCYPVAPEMPSPVVTCDDDAGEVSSSAARGSDTSEQQGYYTNTSVSFFCISLSLSLSLFRSLCAAACLLLLPAAPLISLSALPMPCSKSESLYSDCQWNFVSVSRLSTQSSTHLSDTAVTLCLLIIARLQKDPPPRLPFSTIQEWFIVKYWMPIELEQYCSYIGTRIGPELWLNRPWW